MNTYFNIGRLIAAVALLALCLAGCGGGGGSAAGVSGPQLVLPAPTGQYQGLKFTLTTDKQVYTVGEQVNATLTVTNTSSQPVYFLQVSPADANVLIEQGSVEVWNSMNHTIYDGGVGFEPLPLSPGQAMALPVIAWSQGSDNGQMTPYDTPLPQVPRGQYTIRGFSLDDFYQVPGQPLAWYETNFAAPLVTITIQ